MESSSRTTKVLRFRLTWSKRVGLKGCSLVTGQSGYRMYFKTENEELHTIRNTEPEKLIVLPKPGCLGIACQPQKLIDILRSKPW